MDNMQKADAGVVEIIAKPDHQILAESTPDELQAAFDTAQRIARLTERAATVAMLRADCKTIRENANSYSEEAPSDARALHEVASTLLFKAHQIERGDHNPFAPMTARQLKDIIRAWLDADDATHWGPFERSLNEALEAA